jgi:hypothetical protein
LEFCRILVELELPLMKTFILNATEVSSLGPFIDYWHFFQSKETNSPCSLKAFRILLHKKVTVLTCLIKLGILLQLAHNGMKSSRKREVVAHYHASRTFVICNDCIELWLVWPKDQWHNIFFSLHYNTLVQSSPAGTRSPHHGRSNNKKGFWHISYMHCYLGEW